MLSVYSKSKIKNITVNECNIHYGDGSEITHF